MKEKNFNEEKRQKEMFNSITESVKPKNQNQNHNSKKEGSIPVNQRG